MFSAEHNGGMKTEMAMSTEVAVLRALLLLARRRSPATLEDILAKVGPAAGDPAEIQRALRSLSHAELVQRTGETARLSFAGLAVATAASAVVAKEKSRPRPALVARLGVIGRISPAIRRGRAA